MSDLREQLQAAQRDYAAVRYPGDLVADLRRTGARRPIVRAATIAPIAAAAVVAACLAIAVYVRRDNAELPVEPIVVVEATTESMPSWTDIDTPSWMIPTFQVMVPPAWSVVPTAETLSSVIVSDTESDSTTREAV
jgi:hypothetical protein